MLRLTAPMTLEDVRAVLADQIAEPASWRAVPVLDIRETAYVFTGDASPGVPRFVYRGPG